MKINISFYGIILLFYFLSINSCATIGKKSETDFQDGILVNNLSESIRSIPLSELKIFYGNLHHHSTLSDGSEEIESVLDYTKNSGIVDFLAITDHSQYFDHPEDWRKSASWKRVHDACDAFNEDGVFLAIPGFEWSKNSETGSGGKGHINTFNTEWWATADTSGISVEDYYNMLVASPGSISMFNHPAPNQFNSFAFHTPERDERIVLFEIATRSGRPRFIPRLNSYIAALDKGWHLAPSDNTDSHEHPKWWIENCRGRTAVIADTLTREAIFNAIENRRAYATYDENLRINFTVNGFMMGTILQKPDKMEAKIEIFDPDEDDKISRVEILTEGGEVFASQEFDSNTVDWKIILEPDRKYYFLKITQLDGDLAISSPIWSGN